MQLRRGVALLDAVLALALLGAWWALGLGVLRAQTLAQRLLAQRTEALWAATDLAARLLIHAGGSGLPTLPSAGGSAADCLAGTCTSAQLALAELMGWRTELDAVLPGAQVRLQSGERQVVLVHDFAELPFATQSLDLVVLPHVLEFATEPHQVLREVERVLIPEGQVIVCGFNPVSLWGMRQVGGRMTGAHFLPLDGEFISVPRLKDWLKLLNMEINRGHFGCYAPPCATDKWLERFAFMEKAGNRWWPYLGALYIVQAIKRVKGMRLIGPAWEKRSARVQQAVPATNRMKNDHQHEKFE